MSKYNSNNYNNRSDYVHRQRDRAYYNGERVLLSPIRRHSNEGSHNQVSFSRFSILLLLDFKKQNDEHDSNFFPPQSSSRSNKPIMNSVNQLLRGTKKGRMMVESSHEFKELDRKIVPRKKTRFDQPMSSTETAKSMKRQGQLASVFLESKSNVEEKLRELQNEVSQFLKNPNLILFPFSTADYQLKLINKLMSIDSC